MQATSLIVILIVVNVILSGSGAENIFSEEAKNLERLKFVLDQL